MFLQKTVKGVFFRRFSKYIFYAKHFPIFPVKTLNYPLICN